jgi:hypothetical protein
MFVAERGHEETGVRISYPQRRVALPTESESEKLLATVTARWPEMRRADGAEFVVAFHRILHLGRRDRLDNAHSVNYWCDGCRAWQNQQQISPGVFVGPVSFTAAVLAQGDVAHSMSDNFPFDLSFGLQFGGGGRPSNNQWRRALETGALLEPTPLDRPSAIKSPARVRQLALNWGKVV